MLEASEVYDAYVSDYNSGIQTLESSPQSNDEIPQIQKLEHYKKTFFSSTHKTIKALMKFSCLILTEFQDQVILKQKKKKNYELNVYDWLEFSKNLKSNNLIHLLKHDQEWIKELWEIRNAIEHNGDYFVNLKNFRKSPSGVVLPPTYTYKRRIQVTSDARGWR
jgi:hypothetical protein